MINLKGVFEENKLIKRMKCTESIQKADMAARNANKLISGKIIVN